MRSTDPRALLFDLDGTLVDSLPDIHASADHVRAHFGLPPLGFDAVREMVGDGPRVLLARVLSPTGDAGETTPEQVDAAMEVWTEHHVDQCTRLVRPYPGVASGLAEWRDDGLAIAVVTNKPERFARSILEQLELDGFASVVVGGDTTPRRKPDPTPVRLALDQLDVRPHDAVMIGDGPQDIGAGRAAGCTTVAVTYGFNPQQRLLDHAPDAVWTGFGVPADGHPLFPAARTPRSPDSNPRGGTA